MLVLRVPKKNSRKGVQNYEIQCDTHEKTGSFVVSNRFGLKVEFNKYLMNQSCCLNRNNWYAQVRTDVC